MAVVANRKSLMLDEAEYVGISALAKKANVPRPLVVRALLAVYNEEAVLAKIQELRQDHKLDAQEEKVKRRKLAELANTLDMADIERLIAQAGAGQPTNEQTAPVVATGSTSPEPGPAGGWISGVFNRK